MKRLFGDAYCKIAVKCPDFESKWCKKINWFKYNDSPIADLIQQLKNLNYKVHQENALHLKTKEGENCYIFIFKEEAFELKIYLYYE